MSGKNKILNFNDNESKNSFSNQKEYSEKELSKYFEDIIKNKVLIKEMFNINIEAYEKKINENLNVIESLKEEIEHQKKLHEEELKEMKELCEKYEEDLKKHVLNLKLLMKSKEHYESLIKEKQKEITSVRQKNVFINQDILNRKFQLDSLTAQIDEAEFQKSSLEASVKKKLEELNLSRLNERNECCDISIIEEDTEKYEEVKSHVASYLPPKISNKKEENQVEMNFTILETNKENLDIKSAYNQEIFTSQIFTNEEELSKSFSVDKVNKKKKCVIF